MDETLRREIAEVCAQSDRLAAEHDYRWSKFKQRVAKFEQCSTAVSDSPGLIRKDFEPQPTVMSQQDETSLAQTVTPGVSYMNAATSAAWNSWFSQAFTKAFAQLFDASFDPYFDSALTRSFDVHFKGAFKGAWEDILKPAISEFASEYITKRLEEFTNERLDTLVADMGVVRYEKETEVAALTEKLNKLRVEIELLRYSAKRTEAKSKAASNTKSRSRMKAKS